MQRKMQKSHKFYQYWKKTHKKNVFEFTPPLMQTLIPTALIQEDRKLESPGGIKLFSARL